MRRSSACADSSFSADHAAATSLPKRKPVPSASSPMQDAGELAGERHLRPLRAQAPATAAPALQLDNKTARLSITLAAS